MGNEVLEVQLLQSSGTLFGRLQAGGGVLKQKEGLSSTSPLRSFVILHHTVMMMASRGRTCAGVGEDAVDLGRRTRELLLGLVSSFLYHN